MNIIFSRFIKNALTWSILELENVLFLNRSEFRQKWIGTIIRLLGEQSKLKMSQIVEKVHNFLGCFGLFWIWEKIDFRWTPPRPKLGKIWNVDYFDIVAPPLTLTKTVPKSHQTDTLGLFHSYIGHICTKCSIYLTNISPIYHRSQGHISVIWIWGKCEKFEM